eukprot:g2307.t1
MKFFLLLTLFFNYSSSEFRNDLGKPGVWQERIWDGWIREPSSTKEERRDSIEANACWTLPSCSPIKPCDLGAEARGRCQNRRADRVCNGDYIFRKYIVNEYNKPLRWRSENPGRSDYSTINGYVKAPFQEMFWKDDVVFVWREKNLRNFRFAESQLEEVESKIYPSHEFGDFKVFFSQLKNLPSELYISLQKASEEGLQFNDLPVTEAYTTKLANRFISQINSDQFFRFQGVKISEKNFFFKFIDRLLTRIFTRFICPRRKLVYVKGGAFFPRIGKCKKPPPPPRCDRYHCRLGEKKPNSSKIVGFSERVCCFPPPPVSKCIKNCELVTATVLRDSTFGSKIHVLWNDEDGDGMKWNDSAFVILGDMKSGPRLTIKKRSIRGRVLIANLINEKTCSKRDGCIFTKGGVLPRNHSIKNFKRNNRYDAKRHADCFSSCTVKGRLSGREECQAVKWHIGAQWTRRKWNGKELYRSHTVIGLEDRVVKLVTQQTKGKCKGEWLRTTDEVGEDGVVRPAPEKWIRELASEAIQTPSLCVSGFWPHYTERIWTERTFFRKTLTLREWKFNSLELHEWKPMFWQERRWHFELPAPVQYCEGFPSTEKDYLIRKEDCYDQCVGNIAVKDPTLCKNGLCSDPCFKTKEDCISNGKCSDDHYTNTGLKMCEDNGICVQHAEALPILCEEECTGFSCFDYTPKKSSGKTLRFRESELMAIEAAKTTITLESGRDCKCIDPWTCPNANSNKEGNCYRKGKSNLEKKENLSVIGFIKVAKPELCKGRCMRKSESNNVTTLLDESTDRPKKVFLDKWGNPFTTNFVHRTPVSEETCASYCNDPAVENAAPETFPWEAIKSLFGCCSYFSYSEDLVLPPAAPKTKEKSDSERKAKCLDSQYFCSIPRGSGSLENCAFYGIRKCKDYTCLFGAKKTNVNELLGANENLCCEKNTASSKVAKNTVVNIETTCETFQCSSGFVLKKNPKLILGDSERVCCIDNRQSCESFSCTPPGKKRSDAATIFGSTDEVCCFVQSKENKSFPFVKELNECLSVKCPQNLVQNRDRKFFSNDFEKEDCCIMPFCSDYDCKPLGEQKPNAKKVRGNQFGICCDFLNRAEQVGSGSLKKNQNGIKTDSPFFDLREHWNQSRNERKQLRGKGGTKI